MTQRLSGTIGLVQEERFQLVDDDGGAHLFILDHRCSLTPDDLLRYWRSGGRVSVEFSAAQNIMARIASHVSPENTMEVSR